MKSLLRSLAASEPTRVWGITALRLVVGFAFFLHGWQKVFEFGIPGVTQGFEQMGIPLAALTAPLVAYLELLGGAALIAGLFTRWVSVPLAINMLVATTLVHWSGGFFAPNGIELTLILFAALATLALGGPGALAVDHLLARSTQHWSPETVAPPAEPATRFAGATEGEPDDRRRRTA